MIIKRVESASPPAPLSLTKLGKGGNHGIECIWAVNEGRVVFWAPGELGTDSSVYTILYIALWGYVSYFLLWCLQCFSSGHEVNHFKHGHLLHIANISDGLHLLKMARVVGEVEHKVVHVYHLQLLHLLCLVTNFPNSWFNAVFSFHEGFILIFDLVHNALSMNIICPLIPLHLF